MNPPIRFKHSAARKTDVSPTATKAREHSCRDRDLQAVNRACTEFFRRRGMAPAPFNEFGIVRRPTVASVTEDETASSDPALAFRIEATRDKSTIG